MEKISAILAILLLVGGFWVVGNKLLKPIVQKATTQQLLEEESDFDPYERVKHIAKELKKSLEIKIEESQQKAIKACRDMGGNFSDAVLTFRTKKQKLNVDDPEFEYYKVVNYTQTLYKVCVVGKKVYLPVCELEYEVPFQWSRGTDEYHCFAPVKVIGDTMGMYPFTWMEFNTTINLSPAPPAPSVLTVWFSKWRYAGEVYSNQPLGEETVKVPKE